MTRLSHVDDEGRARMVDVTAKAETHRVATAAGTIRMKSATLDAIRGNQIAKGDVLGVARLAGVMAAKRTADLIPLCHPLPLHNVDVQMTMDANLPGIRVEATSQTVARTGVEMEALTAVSVALLTIYDMAKAIDREMVIGDIVLLAKTGGKSGAWSRLDGTGSAL
ncbi:MAG TPA: cyclic pyranopterin monophosphate synthase MoaC [Gemmatimonadaceae bacterium]|nr:cyclic pyranopterin monophosphate synthase MoaC [Gemmatimonadaceae bacterium]